MSSARPRGQLERLAREQAALCRIATLVARAAPLPEVFAAVVAEVGPLLSADVTGLARFDADDTMTDVAGWSAAGDAPPLGLRGSGVALPIAVEGRLWGMLTVAATGDESPPPGTEACVAAFAELVATAIANAEAHAELTASRARIIAAADETRRDIERTLHEGAQQRLVSLALNVRAAQASVPPELAELSAELDRVARGLTNALDELREFARWIHPASLVERGLARAMRALAQRSAVPVALDVRTHTRFPERVEVAAYYVVLEALANAAEHAQATAVAIELDATDGALLISIRDDGRGGAAFGNGSGLLGLKDRVEALGGRISLDSPVGGGTSLSVELPLVGDNGSSETAGAAAPHRSSASGR